MSLCLPLTHSILWMEPQRLTNRRETRIYRDKTVKGTDVNVIKGQSKTGDCQRSLDIHPVTRYDERRHTVFNQLYVIIFRHLKLELLTQFPASNNETYLYL